MVEFLSKYTSCDYAVFVRFVTLKLCTGGTGQTREAASG